MKKTYTLPAEVVSTDLLKLREKTKDFYANTFFGDKFDMDEWQAIRSLVRSVDMAITEERNIDLDIYEAEAGVAALQREIDELYNQRELLKQLKTENSEMVNTLKKKKYDQLKQEQAGE